MQDYKDKLVRDFRSTDALDRLTEAYMRVVNPQLNEANVKKLPYSAEMYIQQEDGKFIVYFKSHSGSEWFKQVDNKKEAVDEFINAVSRATNKWNKM
jgi:hypothetical protein